ncbi:hypothetical protein EEL30_22565 [Brevibacillus laterosporus]|uniref:Uncharacterized protein n=1 Tax=Brevibacillus laterosporus TaxID=1465 RepID=A0A518VCW2_BRELA|nr:hypothetical protein EEL30_22565 [Brevibacillus laterosporus]
MKKRNVDSLRIYDWTKTIEDVKNRDSKMLRNVPSSFYQEMKDSSMSAKVQGNWGNWELTDEGSGQYPIFKCYIENGTFEVDTNNEKATHHLQNSWIKICLKIEDSQTEMYVISEKEDTLYSINHAFHFNSGHGMVSILLEKLLVTWFKEHRHLLHQQINTYNIQYSTSNDLSLMGWDTSYVTSFSNVNKNIQQKKLYPEKFYYEFTDTSLGFPLEFSLNGTFDSWEITTGADGQNVNFICKINENSFLHYITADKMYRLASREDPNPVLEPYMKIQLKLKYLNSTEKTITDSTGKGNGYQVDLKVKTDQDTSGDQPVILVKTHFSNEIPELIAMFVEIMFKNWFNENIDKFENIFSHLLLEETAKDENFQWLKPTDKYYGVAEGKDENGQPSLDTSVFAVMTMVENRKNNYPQHTVDARLLHAVKNAKDTNDSAFGIDMPLFVDKWLGRGLNIMQVGTPDQFEKTDNGLFIQNKERIQFGTVYDHNENEVPSYVDPKKFRLGITNNQMVLDIEDLTWEQARGIIGHANYTQHYGLSLKSGVDELGKEYKNVLVPSEEGEATLTLTYTLEDWYQREQLIIEIATGLALSIAAGAFFSATSAVFRQASAYISQQFSKIGTTMMRAVISLKELLKRAGTNASQAARREMIELTTFNITRAPSYVGLNSPGVMYQVLQQPRTLWSRIWEISSKSALVFTQMAVIGAAGMLPTAIAKYLDYLAEEHYSELPTIDAFLANCVGAVKWPDNSELQVETARLQGIYLMGGKLIK